jgi:signal transduction histidine kinase
MYAVLFAGAAILAIGYISWISSRLLDDRIKETVLAETLGLAEQYRSGGIKQLANIINRRVRNPSNSIYLVTDHKGGWIAGNVKSLTRDLWNRQGQVEFAYQRRGPQGVEMRHAQARIYRLARDYRLMVGRDVEDQRQFATLIRNAVLWGLAFMVLVGLGGGWLVSRNLLNRIDAVTTTSRVIMAGDMSRRMPLDGTGDELDRLAVSLNAMLERIEQLMMGLREVSDNIAHDLKTPLTRMRNRVETGLRGEGEFEYRDVLEKTIEESDELIRTFNALLSIARLEAGSSNTSFTENDLGEILADVAELYEPLAEEKGLQLELVRPEALSLDVDRQLIGQAIANLIDNAIKYGTPEKNGRGNIVLKAGRLGEVRGKDGSDCSVYIAVSDRGQGIPDNERMHAMKRFGRLEKSRSKPGTGLGLSLVSAVAKLHGGELQLENNMPGLTGRIVIPCKARRMPGNSGAYS